MALHPRLGENQSLQAPGHPTMKVFCVPFHGSGNQGSETRVTCFLRNHTAFNNELCRND